MCGGLTKKLLHISIIQDYVAPVTIVKRKTLASYLPHPNIRAHAIGSKVLSKTMKPNENI